MSGKVRFSASAYVRRTHDQDLEKRLAQHEYRGALPSRVAGQKLRVLSVDPGSLGERIGLEPGDEILELDGQPLRDVIDFQFKASAIGRRMSIRTEQRTVQFVRREWESFGLEFEPIAPMVCDNQCVFCFVHQNPRNVRRSLRIKDEDYRLSFLFGNYLTLTNVHDDEMRRIVEQRLSPLYVSVHATEPDVRAFLLGNQEYDGLMEKIERLSAGGIALHCQVVLCPGLNDDVHLERTIDDLVRMYPGVRSLAVVPVGLTGHRRNLPELEPVTPAYARQTIECLRPVQRRFEQEIGFPFVFLGDEFYIMAGEPVPPDEHYGDFPLIENGVGMVRRFMSGFEGALRRWKPGKARGTVCTGGLFYGTLKGSVDRLGLDLKTVAVESRFWGPGINVAGLLTGSDFISALRGNVYGDFVVLPSECMIAEERLFLDDLTIKDVERELGVRVVPSGYAALDFLEMLEDLQ